MCLSKRLTLPTIFCSFKETPAAFVIRSWLSCICFLTSSIPLTASAISSFSSFVAGRFSDGAASEATGLAFGYGTGAGA